MISNKRRYSMENYFKILLLENKNPEFCSEIEKNIIKCRDDSRKIARIIQKLGYDVKNI
jgi:hypothetical protein